MCFDPSGSSESLSSNSATLLSRLVAVVWMYSCTAAHGNSNWPDIHLARVWMAMDERARLGVFKT